jgi:3-oxoacyl-[acyl-carrier-protein] synthase III
MKLAWPLQFAGTGISLPRQVVTNDDLAQRVETSNDWIVQRTGIRQRHIAADDESTLSLATAASQAALADAGLRPEDIDLIIVPTISPEHPLPATACELQAALGCGLIPAFDLQAACSGFVWGLISAGQFIETGLARNILLVGAETLSRITDWEDRATCVLFGDGAAAAVLTPSSNPEQGILAARMGADGARGKAIWVPGGGSAEPTSQKTVDERLHFMKMQGREVYKFAVQRMQQIIRETADDAGVALADIKAVIPHQSNARIIESARDKLGLAPEQVIINIDRFGNTSAASVPIAFHELRTAGKLQPGDLVMMVAFGAGLTWGSVLARI